MILPGRLTAGLAGLALIGTAVLVGPLLLDRAPVPDPTHAALAPPGARLLTVDLVDGQRITGRLLGENDDSVRLQGTPAQLTIDRSLIASISSQRSWLGTDRYGRDLMGLLVRGGRISFAIAAFGAAIALLVGLVTGLAAATLGPIADAVLMRTVDALLAFPSMLLLILASAVFEPGPLTLILLLGLTSWMSLARLVRGQVLSIRERPYVLAARVAGTPWHRMWTWHYLTGIRAPVAQDLALRMGDLVLAEATLSFLGLGMPATTPTWGYLVNEGQRVMLDAWWVATIPGLAIAALVISCALIGDGMQDLG